MSKVLYPFMIFSIIGFVLSLIAHLLSLFSVGYPIQKYEMLLHIGLFIAFIPAIISFEPFRKINSKNTKNIWKETFKYCPKWMYYFFYTLLMYMSFNFFYFIFFLQKNGNENTVRGFSGHWLFFYFAAFMILYVNINRSKNMLPRFINCPSCGIELDLETNERIEKRFTCPTCSKKIDLSKKYHNVVPDQGL